MEPLPRSDASEPRLINRHGVYRGAAANLKDELYDFSMVSESLHRVIAFSRAVTFVRAPTCLDRLKFKMILRHSQDLTALLLGDTI